ncbi:MAG: hypothetical protein JXA14_15790 [Anaerolineae bacterium]|nr:hypothetical protein [Anaerolineae bacterium]
MKKTLRYVLDFARRPGVRGSLIALAVYTLIASFVLYPVPFSLNSVLAGFPARDGWEHAWWLWFARRLLLQGRGLDDLYLLNHPFGLQHPYQWSLVSFSLIASFFSTLFPPAAAYNLMVLSSFILGGLAAYHLCRELTGEHWPAVVGGAIFAFCPNRLGHALAGWLPQMTVYLFPWYTLLLLRTLQHPTWRRSIGLGVLAGMAATIWPIHLAYFMVPVTVVIAGDHLIRLKLTFFKERRIPYLGLSLAIALLITLPFLLPVISRRFEGEMDYLAITGVVSHSTDLLAFFTPSPYHPVLASLGVVPPFAQRVFANQEALRAGLAYPGLIAVLLGAWGMLRSRPRPWLWLVLAVGTAVLSLGPILVVGGEAVEYTVEDHRACVSMPYLLVRTIPFLDWIRTPGRINTTGMLGLGVLAAFGLRDLLSRFSVSRWLAGLLILAVTALIIFEYLPMWPFVVGDATIPSVIQYIAEQPGDGGMLNVTMRRRSVNNRSLYYQTATGRPIVGGTVLRTLPDVLPWQETIEGLVKEDSTPDVVPRPSLAQRQIWLRHFNIDWVLLHKEHPGDEERYRPFIEELLGDAAVEDEILVAYPVPFDESVPASSIIYTFSGQGWREPEQDGDAWRRWMYDDGWLYIYSTAQESGSLRFTVDSHLTFPVLEVYLGEQLVDAFVVGERATYTTRSFTLAQGMNVFRFHAPGGCPDVLDDPRCWSDALLVPPAGDATPPCDMPVTCRTFVFDGISFAAQDDLPAGATLDVNFGDQVRLRGWGLDEAALHPGDVLAMTLAWEPMVELNDRYVAFVHLISFDGSLVAQHDGALVGKRILPSAWPPGTVFSYPVTLELPDDLPAGDYRLVAGVYLWPELERLPVLSDVPGAENNGIELETVRVAP